jgi:hypothetical protein
MAAAMVTGYGERMPSLLVTPNAMKCPTCRTPLVAAERREQQPQDELRFRAGAPVPRGRSIPVWRCTTCCEDRARFE